jgi:hypothetical protein
MTYAHIATLLGNYNFYFSSCIASIYCYTRFLSTKFAGVVERTSELA